MEKIQVLLLSRDAAVRASLARLLEREPDLEVHEAPEGPPDVVVANINDVEQAIAVRLAFPSSRILGRVSVLRPDLRECRELDGALDSVAPYEAILEAIRDLAHR